MLGLECGRARPSSYPRELRVTMDIADHDTSLLKHLLGIGVDDPVPKDVEEAYWRLHRLCARVRQPITPALMVTLLHGMGYGEAIPSEQETIADKWRKGKLKPDAKVKTKWRGKTIEVELVGVSNDGLVKVRMPSGEEPELRQELVKC